MLKTLSDLTCMSGNEKSIIDVIKNNLTCKADVKTDNMNNLIVSCVHDESLSTVVLSAHMDEPGFIITDITDDGYLKFDIIGDINPTDIVSKQVKIGNCTGIISLKAIHLTTKEEREKPVKTDDLFIDIGAKSKEDAKKTVIPGDYCYFISDFSEFGEASVKGKSLSSRAGCRILVDILNNNSFSKLNLICIFTTQKEVASRGAVVALKSIDNPMLAIVLDGIGCTDNINISKGPVVCYTSEDTLKSRLLINKTEDICFVNKLSVQKMCADKEKTDLISFKSQRTDIPSILIGVPCKYKNTASEAMALNDIGQAYDLIYNLLSEVNNGFIL